MTIRSLFLCFLLPATMSAAAQTTAHAQEPDYAAGWPVPGSVAHMDNSSVARPDYKNDISIHAVRDFLRRFDTVASPRWFRTDDGGCLAKFEVPGIGYRVAYTKKGAWVYTLRHYHEKQMPGAIRHLVKSAYYDYAITGVTDIEQYNITDKIYIIYMEDDHSYLTLRVYDGGVEVMQQLEKAKR